MARSASKKPPNNSVSPPTRSTTGFASVRCPPAAAPADAGAFPGTPPLRRSTGRRSQARSGSSRSCRHCGQRRRSLHLLAERGAHVVGVEPGQSLFDFAVEKERDQPRNIRYVQADLCTPPDLGAPFDAVVASMVLPAIPDWTGAMRACVHALKPGGLFVFTLNHPCFERLWPTWRDHGEYRTRRYLAEYEIPGPSGVDFHRTISTYLNQLISLSCQVAEVA